MPTYLLCKHARSEVTVALGGDGVDELFGVTVVTLVSIGGLTHQVFIIHQNAKGLFSSRFWFGLEALSIFEGLEMETENFISSLSTNLYPPVNTEQAIRFVDFKSYLPGAALSKVDRMSMLVSLEVRTPFFLHKLDLKVTS